MLMLLKKTHDLKGLESCHPYLITQFSKPSYTQGAQVFRINMKNNSIGKTVLQTPSKSSTSQKSPHDLRKPKDHYGVHTIPPLLPVLSQMNPVHTFILFI
jgi:hypothetical protein